MNAQPIEVAVTAVRNPAGEVLMAQRRPHQLSPGCWELPGGKIERGETAADAAARELFEETGLEAVSLRPLMQYAHDFPRRRVAIHAFAATVWRGTPQGREGQRLAWVAPGAPQAAPILPSVTRLLTALALPSEMEIVELDGPPDAGLAQARAALARGVKLIQLRAGRLATDQKVALARRIAATARDQGARTMLAGTALEAGRAAAQGVHSRRHDFLKMQSRPPLPLWSVEARDDNDLQRAAALGADFVIALSDGLAQGAGPPLYALGAGRAWRRDAA